MVGAIPLWLPHFLTSCLLDIGAGVIGVIEFATVDAEELQGLVEFGFGELGLQELGELGEVDGLGVAMV